MVWGFVVVAAVVWGERCPFWIWILGAFCFSVSSLLLFLVCRCFAGFDFWLIGDFFFLFFVSLRSERSLGSFSY